MDNDLVGARTLNIQSRAIGLNADGRSRIHPLRSVDEGSVEAMPAGVRDSCAGAFIKAPVAH